VCARTSGAGPLSCASREMWCVRPLNSTSVVSRLNLTANATAVVQLVDRTGLHDVMGHCLCVTAGTQLGRLQAPCTSSGRMYYNAIAYLLPPTRHHQPPPKKRRMELTPPVSRAACPGTHVGFGRN